jgi:nucleoside-diphosphate-sugar epimerase
LAKRKRTLEKVGIKVKILITGNMGYIGPVLTSALARAFQNAELIGYDQGFFGHALTGASVHPEHLLQKQYFGDVREITSEVLTGVDAVVHLAAVSNDPMGNQFAEVTTQINQDASVRLAHLATQAGVKNFVFASSCSMYGQADGGARRESDQLNPLTAYARSKVAVEENVRSSDLDRMVFTSLRFSTACGWSSRLRLDLVLNDFVACAIASKNITVLSDGSPWRPLIDVEDMCRAIIWGISRTATQGGQFLAINAGSDQNNYRVKDLALAVAEQVPDTTVTINQDAPPDKRSYKVDFSLYRTLAPDHQPQVSIKESICKLRDGLLKMAFTDSKFRDSNFIRLNLLRQHIEANRLGQDLRWK